MTAKLIEPDDTDTPIDEDLDDMTDEESLPPVEPQPIKSGGRPALATKRGRGRPKKGDEANFISQLPTPPRKLTTKPDEFFAYLRSIPADKLTRITLTFYRYLPICDISEGGKKAKSIDIIPGEDHPFHDEDWETQILHRYGCGNYGCFLNEENRNTMICRKINTIWDPETYPPLVDPKTLLNHANNGAYIAYLRQRGVKVPTANDREDEQNEMQLGETINKLTDTVIAQSMRMNTPVPQMVGQSATEKLTLEGATAVISMVKDAAHMQAQKDTGQSDPMAIVNSIVAVAEKMNGGGDKGPDPILMMILKESQEQKAKMEERVWEMQKEQNKLMERLMTPQNGPSMVDEFEKLAKMKEAAKTLFGGGGEEEAPTPHGSGGWKQMLAENLPVLVQGAFGLVDRFQSAAVSIAAANAAAKAGIPVQQAVAQAQATAAASNPQPEQPPINVPPGMNIEQLRQYHHMLGSITGPILNHIRDEQNGHTFAEWFIGGNGMIAYRRVARLGKEQKPDGTIAVNIEPLMTVIKTYPPLWNEVGVIEPEFRQFLTQFIEFGDLPEEGEGEGDAEEKGVDEDEEVIA